MGRNSLMMAPIRGCHRESSLKVKDNKVMGDAESL